MPPPRVPVRARCLAPLAGLALAAVAACGGRRDGAPTPAAEFLLSAGDSTYWVASGPGGTRLRASSLLLGRWGGRLYEIYATDDDRSFEDAVFVAQQVWRRDLLTGDSTLVLADDRVPRESARYAVAHPDEPMLEPGEQGAAEPASTVSADVAFVALHGAYLTLDRFADEEGAARRERHEVRRRVLDLRTGRPATLAALFGPTRAALLEAEGRRRLQAHVAALRAAADAGALDDEPAVDVAGRRALGTLRLEADGFGLAAVDGAPAVTFVARGTDVAGHDVTLALAPIAVPGPAPGWWAADVHPTLPTWSADSAIARWAPPRDSATGGSGYLLRAQPLRGAPERAAPLALALELPGGPARASAPARPARDAATRVAHPSGALATVAGPLHALFALDAADRETRRAVRRAFDASALYDAGVTTVAWRAPAAGRALPLVRRAARRLRPGAASVTGAVRAVRTPHVQ